MEKEIEIEKIKKIEIKIEKLKTSKVLVSTVKKKMISEKYFYHILRYKKYCA